MTTRPTPEELGRMLEAGEITREEAVEQMSQRIREEAFETLFSGSVPAGAGAPGAAEESRAEKGDGRISAATRTRLLLWAAAVGAVVVLGLIGRYLFCIL